MAGSNPAGHRSPAAVHGQSFPAGHATAAAAMAVAASLLIVAVGVRRRHLVVAVPVGYAVVICLSRIVLGVQFLTDVVAGGDLGVAVSLSLAGLWARTARSTAPKGPMI